MNKRDRTKILIEKKIYDWTKKKKFLLPNTSLIGMGKELDINRTYLSDFINRRFEKNFNSWINEMRIREAQKLIRRYPKWQLSIIGEKVGFSDQAHFCKQFKLIVGTNPKKWKK